MLIPPDNWYPKIFTKIEHSWLFILFAVVIGVIGVGFLIYGCILLMRQQMGLLPRHLTKKVKEKDFGEMTAQIGCACIIPGIGFSVSCVMMLISGSLGLGILIALISLAVGCIVFDKAISKYNKP